MQREKQALNMILREDATAPITRCVVNCSGFTLEYSEMVHSSDYDFKSVNPKHHYLAFHDLVLKDGEITIDGCEPIRGKNLRDTLTFIPSGRAFTGWAAPVERKNSFTAITYHPEIVAAEIEETVLLRELSPEVYFRNENLKSTMLKLEHALKSDIPHSSLYVETLGVALVLEMNEQFQTSGRIRSRGGLSLQEAGLIDEYIRSHITQDITLNQLATLVGMSRFHVSRAFKLTFGEPPIRYINRQRCIMAKVILAQSRQPVMEIAVQLGFGSIQQFNRVFRYFTGQTPTEFRKQS